MTILDSINKIHKTLRGSPAVGCRRSRRVSESAVDENVVSEPQVFTGYTRRRPTTKGGAGDGDVCLRPPGDPRPDGNHLSRSGRTSRNKDNGGNQAVWILTARLAGGEILIYKIDVLADFLLTRTDSQLRK